MADDFKLDVARYSGASAGGWRLVPMADDIGSQRIVAADLISPGIVYGGIREAEANARLIADAPLLLAEAIRLSAEVERLTAERGRMKAALERSLSWLSSYPGGNALGAYDAARSALANLINPEEGK